MRTGGRNVEIADKRRLDQDRHRNDRHHPPQPRSFCPATAERVSGVVSNTSSVCRAFSAAIRPAERTVTITSAIGHKKKPEESSASKP